jgi:triosephosphate isomerase
MKSTLIANWKMNPASFKEAKRLFDATKKAADSAKEVSITIAPPSIYLRELRTAYRGKKLSFAIQHAHAEAAGSFTGEISLQQAKDAGATSVIIGHAERRAMGETNEDTQVKVSAALALSLAPILCVGENTRKPDGEHFEFIKEQLKTGFASVLSAKISRVTIAYEPIWAIGASAAMNPRDMHEMAIFIRKTIVGLYGEKGMAVKILYGGSIDETNAAAMLREGDVAGLLVGRSSTSPATLTALVEAMKRA